MARRQDSRRSSFRFRNPFRMIMPKGSALSPQMPQMLDLLNTFEENLAGRLKKLKPTCTEDVVCSSWMRSAVVSLCELHADIENLITSLELPVSHWDEKWIDVYMDNSMKLMKMCVSLNSEIKRLEQSRLFLLCALYDLDSDSATKFLEARTSLDEWRQQIGSNNRKLDNVFSIMDSLAKTLNLPKLRNSSKEKVFMKAMYACRVVTLFVCSTFAAALSGSAKKLMDIKVRQTFSWAVAFADLQTFVNTEIIEMNSNGNGTFLKEREAVETAVNIVYTLVQDGVDNYTEVEALQNFKLDLEDSAEKFSEGFDVLAKEVDGFLKLVVKGRNALLSNFRCPGNGSDEVVVIVEARQLGE